MSGAGKTTLGKKLAKLLMYSFVDMDDLIIEQEGKSIEQIFEIHGEDYFRQKETKVLRSLIDNNDNLLISTGGGTPCFYDNISLINSNGLSIWISPSAETIALRLWNSENRENRPMLKNKTESEVLGFVINKLNERTEFYSQSKIKLQSDSIQAEDLFEIISSNI